MALSRIKKGDQVKVIAGKHKGKVATVQAVLRPTNAVLLAGVGERKRHVAASRAAAAGKRDIQNSVSLSNVAIIVDSKTNKTSRIAAFTKPSGEKVRTAKSLKNKEIT